MTAPLAASTFVALPASVRDEISNWAAQAYPHEGCGLLVGRFVGGGGKEVVRLARLTNALLARTVTDAPTLPTNRQGKGTGKTEFLMDPSEFNRETLNAEREGLDVVGVIHTHPDHPPRPSQVDASQPFLANWSNVIVSVEKGKMTAMKSWYRENDNDPFVEEEIRLV